MTSPGQDTPEAQFYGLDQVAEPPGGKIGWRGDAKYCLVWRRRRSRLSLQGNFQPLLQHHRGIGHRQASRREDQGVSTEHEHQLSCSSRTRRRTQKLLQRF
ncbi:MAG: hypothetical protein KME46_32000 [Brasilonema angustatum HA4187-MV1]|nr:hypothetical protein [Brasilonema angustatum HA4187-MV1]